MAQMQLEVQGAECRWKESEVEALRAQAEVASFREAAM